MYIILLLFFSEACNDCSSCQAGDINIIRNTCTGDMNNTFYPNDLGCTACQNPDCQSAQACQIDSSCGTRYMSSSAMKVKINKLNRASFCVWYVDFRDMPSFNFDFLIEYGAGLIPDLVIRTYYLNPNEASPKMYLFKNLIWINQTNYNSKSVLSLVGVNYVVIVCYSRNQYGDYSSLSISWDNTSQSNTLSTILTIIALCLALVFCVGCCTILCRRLYKSRGSSLIYSNMINAINRNERNYLQVPETTIISEGDMDRLFPKELFKDELLEAGEKICCICFEEYWYLDSTPRLMSGNCLAGICFTQSALKNGLLARAFFRDAHFVKGILLNLEILWM